MISKTSKNDIMHSWFALFHGKIDSKTHIMWMRKLRTVWIFSNFLGILILPEINFSYFSEGQNLPFLTILGTVWILDSRLSLKFPNTYSKLMLHEWSKWQFVGHQNDRNWFHVKSEWQKILQFPHCVFPILRFNAQVCNFCKFLTKVGNTEK